MISQAITVHNKFIIILSQYIIFPKTYVIRYMMHNSQQEPSELSHLSLPRTIAFIPSEAKTQKKEIMPYPRCGFGACLRCG